MEYNDIEQLKKDKIIDDYGNIDFDLFIERCRENALNSPDDDMSTRDIYDGMTIDQLLDIARTINEDLRIDLMRGRVHIDDAEALVKIFNLIDSKRNL